MFSKKKFSLYIHIPFCVSKCSYCDFCSFVAKNEQVNAYLSALNAEIKARAQKYKNYDVTSVYIGGGTPSILPYGAISSILDEVRGNFDIKDKNITIEANPNSFTREKAEEYSKAGCNRVSFGLQSHSPRILSVLNRKHNFADLENSVQYALEYGINDINVDIMLGVPTQTLDDIKETLQRVIGLPITHISAYGLICEPNTPLTKAIEKGELTLPDEDETVNMYDLIVDFLEKHGFSRYEISNFAKEGYESIHNKNYWARGEYLGLGLAAYSFVNGVHWNNTENFSKYLSNPTESIENVEPETLETAKEEFIMLALRTTKGLNIAEYNKLFGADFLAEHKETIKKLIDENLVKIENGFLIINNPYISNAIIAEFFD